jgi:hypothetical protein
MSAAGLILIGGAPAEAAGDNLGLLRVLYSPGQTRSALWRLLPGYLGASDLTAVMEDPITSSLEFLASFAQVSNPYVFGLIRKNIAPSGLPLDYSKLEKYSSNPAQRVVYTMEPGLVVGPTPFLRWAAGMAGRDEHIGAILAEGARQQGLELLDVGESIREVSNGDDPA